MYKSECEKWRQAIIEKADAFYSHQITATQELIDHEIAKGKNPESVALEGGIATINYRLLLRQTQESKSSAHADAEARTKTCDENAIPDWLQDPQKISDFALAVALMPFVALTKQYAAAHIDLGEIYKGRTMGGDGALIPKFREDAFKALGIGGDVAQFARDPVNETRKVVNDIVDTITHPPTLPPPNIPGVRLW
ncbi:hypothetical protein [Delftia tsuruhatensis]|uniref:hypothetical protein n=1 Tax=Delftia tsuruhatensis TaxID=180282 RepID=UPI000B0DF743|nr:hypothetical protein [Delftia tsuruhatensis]